MPKSGSRADKMRGYMPTPENGLGTAATEEEAEERSGLIFVYGELDPATGHVLEYDVNVHDGWWEWLNQDESVVEQFDGPWPADTLHQAALDAWEFALNGADIRDDPSQGDFT